MKYLFFCQTNWYETILNIFHKTKISLSPPCTSLVFNTNKNIDNETHKNVTLVNSHKLEIITFQIFDNLAHHYILVLNTIVGALYNHSHTPSNGAIDKKQKVHTNKMTVFLFYVPHLKN